MVLLVMNLLLALVMIVDGALLLALVFPEALRRNNELIAWLAAVGGPLLVLVGGWLLQRIIEATGGSDG